MDVKPNIASPSVIDQEQNQNAANATEISQVAKIREGLQLMASRHSLEELEASMNTCDVLEGAQNEKSVHFHLDEKHMGIGGDNSWLPAV